MNGLLSFIERHEHRLSTLVFITGFVTDLLTLTLLDLRQINLVFLAYLGIAALLTICTHTFRQYVHEPASWLRSIAVCAPLGAAFTIGSILSGCLILFTRSSALSVSWPFLLLLGMIFLGNELFRSYRSHLVFQGILFFFALYAYLIFAMPLYTHVLAPWVFLWSTTLAVLFFALFMCVLALFSRQQFSSTLWQVIGGAAGIVAVVVGLYYSGLVPPIPLTLMESGVYHSITRTPDGYVVTHEGAGRWSRFLERTVHHVPGTPLYAYGAVFAPAAFSENVIHRWERYDPARGAWVTESVVAFTLSGGRKQGYRGYSEKSDPKPGTWRVSIETLDGQVIGRLRFEVVNVSVPPRLYTSVR
ncbi:MAG TPA: DUF2914 domain-containing protein [Candidatus Paceibacterota bacterium]|jgi:hypothetical protein